MPIPSIIPNRISSLRPSKRKIVRTIYTTEKFAKNIQSEIPNGTKGLAEAIYEGCKSLRMKLTKN